MDQLVLTEKGDLEDQVVEVGAATPGQPLNILVILTRMVIHRPALQHITIQTLVDLTGPKDLMDILELLKLLKEDMELTVHLNLLLSILLDQLSI